MSSEISNPDIAERKKLLSRRFRELKARISEIQKKTPYREKITIVIAAKYARSAEDINALLEAGATDFGENRIQGLEKFNLIDKKYKEKFNLHFIGHLQTNKVKKVVERADLIQSVESLKLAQAIDREASKINKVQDVLLQLNLQKNVERFGFLTENIDKAASSIGKLENVRVKGVMTMAPYIDSDECRPYFKRARKIAGDLASVTGGSILSMGMSNDYRVAIEEGSNMVRIGSAIFGG